MIDIEAWKAVGQVIDAASGVIFLALGLWVGLVRPRTGVGVAFALVAVGWGLRFFVGNLIGLGAIARPPGLATMVVIVNLAVVAGFLWLGTTFPGRLRAGDKSAAIPALVITAASIVWYVVMLVVWPIESTTTKLDGRWIQATDALAYLAWTLLPILLFGRLRRADPSTSHLIFLVTVAMVLLPSVSAGRDIVFLARDISVGDWIRPVFLLVRPLLLLTLVGFWLRRSLHLEARNARNVTIAVAAPMIGSAALAMWVGPVDSLDLGQHGLTRIIGAGILAYAILKHRLFDIDVKLRWGIQRSTVAAIFVAVFVGVQTFVSEFFTDRAGLVWGALAAALLVFGLTPLQNFGDKISKKAIPNALPIASAPLPDRRRLYGELVGQAWADGALSKAEARVLQVAQERLGLTAEQAMAEERAARG